MVQGRRLKFDKAVIATGASPAVPNIPGLKVITLFEIQSGMKV